MIRNTFTAAIAATLLSPNNVHSFSLSSFATPKSKASSLCASSNVPILFTNDDEPSRNKGIDEVSQKIAFYSAGSTSKRKALFLAVTKAAVTLSMLVMLTNLQVPSALAVENVGLQAVPVVEHLHVGQKVANYFKSFGLPDMAILAVISALPVIELRGAVPVGLWMGLPITKVLPVCVFGNMVPIVPLLFLLRNERLKNAMKPILDRAEKKSSSLGVGSMEKQWASLAAFVGIPLPGTGAWTGAMGAFLLGMPTAVAVSSIFTGVVSAGVIMSAITLAGKKGGLAALAVLAIFTGREFMKSDSDK